MKSAHVKINTHLCSASEDRYCRDCEVLLDDENQYPSCKKQGQWVCKKCWNERFYLAVRKKRYGLTEGEFHALCVACDWKCEICRKPLVKKAVCVDHDHDTGEVRGILCQLCNSGIGMLGDDHETVLAAYNYLIDKRLRTDSNRSGRGDDAEDCSDGGVLGEESDTGSSSLD